MMFKVIEIQGIVVSCRGEILIHVHCECSKVDVVIITFRDASDELFQGDIPPVAREVAMVGEGVNTGTWTAT